VLAPKARGAWHLHELTRERPLDHFVGFSSVAVAIGNAGQVSYVAANAFLDALAAHRRAAGLAGLSIQWGVLRDVGVVTRNRQVGDMLEASGMHGLSTAQALEGLAMALRSGRSEIGLFDVDWERWTASNANAAGQPLFAKLRAAAQGQASPALKLARELLLVDPDRRVSELAERLRRQIADLLQVSVDQIGMRQSLTELGVDSLLALELVVGLEAHGFELNVVDLMQGPTVMSLAERQVASLADKLRAHADDLVASVDDMSEQEVEALVAFLQDGQGPVERARVERASAPGLA
jgi:aryl carrier-like protein